MYKSIVFDLGGVMIDFDPRGYLVDACATPRPRKRSTT